MGEQASEDFASQLHYENEEITVTLGRGNDPSAVMAAACSAPPVPDRRSKRTRQAATRVTGAGEQIGLRVSGESTIRALKLQIWEALNVSRWPIRTRLGHLGFIPRGGGGCINFLANSLN